MSVNKVNVKTAQQNRSTADLGTVTITTSDFFTPRVVYNHEFVPGEHWKVHFNSMTRCLPLYKPAYADINQHVRGYFVPYRTLLANFNDSLENCRVAYVNRNFPYFTSRDVVSVLINNYSANTKTWVSDVESVECTDNTFLEPVQGSSFPEGKFDFEYYYTSVDEEEVTHYYHAFCKLTRSGKSIWSNLIGLGYKIDTLGDITDDESYLNDRKSAMPLLSLCKVWLDYYCSPRETSYKIAYNVLRDVFLCKVTNLATNLQYSSTTISYLEWIFNIVDDVNYNLDYFTSAWENPMGPDDGQAYQNLTIHDPAYEVVGSGNLPDNVVSMFPSGTTGTASAAGAQVIQDVTLQTRYVTTLSQYLDTALHLVSDRLKRYQLSGLRSVDRYLSQYGIKLKSEYDNRTVYLGNKKSQFIISDVTSLGDSDSLASYKGKATDYNFDGSFDFNGEEFGFIVMISTVVPSIKYFQGEARHVHHETLAQLFDPTWEKLGVQAIRADELYSGYVHQSQMPLGFGDYIPSDHSVGYTDKFAEYKCNPHAVLSGDFIFETVNTGMRAWHTFREIEWRRARLDEFLRSTTDRLQYDRIFENVNNLADGFIQVFHFDVPASLPMARMFDSYEWSDENGKSVQQQNGGSFNN